MPTTAISPGPVINILQGVVYALPGSPCVITTGVACERSNLFAGPYTAWSGSTSGAYNHVGGFVKCASGNTTIQALKVKMDGSVYQPGSGVAIRDDDAAYSALIHSDRPSYYWSLNDESGLVAVDSVGGANGTISGGVTLNQAGAVGKGMLFDGVNGRIKTAQNIIVPAIVTIEAWIKINMAASYNTIFTNRGGAWFPLLISISGAGAILVYADQGTPQQVLDPILLPSGQWHHVVIVHDNITCKIYVNSILDISSPQTRGGIPLPALGSIGSHPDGGNFWNGTLDEVAIYPYALSAAQIKSHYLAKSVPPNSYASAVMKSAPTNYWQMDEEGGLVAVDIVGGKHGTISGGVTLGQAGIGKSYLLDGATGKVQTSVPVTARSPLTIEWWVRTVTATSGIAAWEFISFPSDATDIPTFLLGTANSLRCHIVHGPGDLARSELTAHINTVLADNKWHHIVWMFTSTFDVYIDGVFVTNATKSGTLFRPLNITNKFQVSGPGAVGNLLNGGMDEVAIYNRALSANEIQSHYLAKFGITNPSSYAAKVVMSGASNYWRLNELSGLSFADMIGGNTGNIGASTGLTYNISGIGGDKGLATDGNQAPIILGAITIGTTFSAEFWFKPTISIGAIYAGIVGPAGGGAGIYYYSDKINCVTAGNNFNNTLLIPHQLYHVVVSVNAGNGTFYINGVADGTFTGWTGATFSGLLKLGGGGITADLIDEVAIYPRALTPTEIADHFASRNS